MKIIAVLLMVVGMFGCDRDVTPNINATSKTNDTIDTVRFLCVGMEMSKRFGACPGCNVDANRMASLLADSFGYKGEVLISEAATKDAVVAKLTRGIEETPDNGLFLFCYSGHGGQEYLGGKEPDGSDRADEYLCLYDRHLLDDEIWEIVSRCKGRVFLYFDACHSATMYRSVSSGVSVASNECVALSARNLIKSKGFHFDPEKFMTATALSLNDVDGPRNQVRILCWSGCKEEEFSFGSNMGGVMTGSLWCGWRAGITYDALWRIVVKGVQAKQPTQHPVQTKIGTGFDGMEAFR